MEATEPRSASGRSAAIARIWRRGAPHIQDPRRGSPSIGSSSTGNSGWRSLPASRSTHSGSGAGDCMLQSCDRSSIDTRATFLHKVEQIATERPDGEPQWDPFRPLSRPFSVGHSCGAAASSCTDIFRQNSAAHERGCHAVLAGAGLTRDPIPLPAVTLVTVVTPVTLVTLDRAPRASVHPSPRAELQWVQLARRLDGSAVPPRDRGTT